MLRSRLAEFDVTELLLFATHTHTGPGVVDSTFGSLCDVSNDTGVMRASEYADPLLRRVAKAAEQAWNNRTPVAMGWAMSHAGTGLNGCSVYANGSAVMYGNTAEENFAHVESGTDTAADVLGFWSPDAALSGVVVNRACPSQETVTGIQELFP
jgi:hypothetical protein